MDPAKKTIKTTIFGHTLTRPYPDKVFILNLGALCIFSTSVRIEKSGWWSVTPVAVVLPFVLYSSRAPFRRTF